MYLLPMPKKVSLGEGVLCAAAFKADFGALWSEQVSALLKTLEKEAAEGCTGGTVNIIAEKNTEFTDYEEYTLTIDKDGIKIYAGDARGVFYALQTLRQIVYTEKCFPYCEIYDKPDFSFRGLQNDTTRGRVPSLAGLKKMADMCAFLKINKIALYFEHSFAFRELSDIVTQEESLNSDELKEFVEYCRLLYIDVIPYVAMLGHQYRMLQSEKYRHLCEIEDFVPENHLWKERMLHHTMDISNPESLELVKSFIDQLSEVFPYKIYIPGVDESWDLGKGRNKGCNVIEAYCSFVDKICAYLEKHNKTALIADDIILNHENGFLIKSENTLMYHWDYAKEPDEEKYAVLSEKGLGFVAVCSTSSFNGPIERPGISIPNIINTAALAKKYNASGILNTIWGDRGHWCDFNGNLFSVCAGASLSWNTDTKVKSEEFEKSFSAIIYGEKEENIRRLIGSIAVLTFNASMYHLTSWYSENLVSEKNTKLELIEPETPHSDFIRRALEKEKEITKLLKKHPEKRELYESLSGVCGIIEALNLLSQALTEERRLTEGERKTLQRRLEEYHTLWLRDNKEGEFYENRAFIDGIISYLDRF